MLKKQSFLPAGIYNIGCRQNSNLIVCVCMDRVRNRRLLSPSWGTDKEYIGMSDLEALVNAHDVIAFLFQYPDVETKNKKLTSCEISPDSIGLIEPSLAQRLIYKTKRTDTHYLSYNHLWFSGYSNSGSSVGNNFSFVKSKSVGMDNALLWNGRLACMWTPIKDLDIGSLRCSGESGMIYDDTEVVSILESGSARHRDVHIGTRLVVEIPSGVCMLTMSDIRNGMYSLACYNYSNELRAWVLEGDQVNTRLIGIRRGANK